MKVGHYTVRSVVLGHFRLDGGSMFGSVPKALWQRSVIPDADNCVPLVCRSLLIEGHGRKILIDVGMGEKWSEKERKIYAINNTPEGELGFSRESITDVILTHLHFDHAGGASYRSQDGVLKLSYPNATIHLQRSNWEHAQKPSLKEKASYIPDNITPLTSGSLSLLNGKTEILPGIWCHPANGHTHGQQWIELISPANPMNSLYFATDLVPTAHHLPLPFHMGFDLCAETLLREKQEFLDRAVSQQAVVVFEHDPDVVAARVAINDRGHYGIKELIPHF